MSNRRMQFDVTPSSPARRLTIDTDALVGVIEFQNHYGGNDHSAAVILDPRKNPISATQLSLVTDDLDGVLEQVGRIAKVGLGWTRIVVERSGDQPVTVTYRVRWSSIIGFDVNEFDDDNPFDNYTIDGLDTIGGTVEYITAGGTGCGVEHFATYDEACDRASDLDRRLGQTVVYLGGIND